MPLTEFIIREAYQTLTVWTTAWERYEDSYLGGN